VTVAQAFSSGDFVRRAGEDVQPGDVAVRAGAFIGAAQVGLLAAVGRDKVLVHPRPRVSVISLGAELVDVSRTPGHGQVYDVNSFALARTWLYCNKSRRGIAMAYGQSRHNESLL
jgi:molybdopterin molybdotransferase